MSKEVVRKAIVDGDNSNNIASVVQSLSDPTKYGLVICKPDGSPIGGGGGGGITDGDKGDITVSAGGTAWNIDAGVVGTTELSLGVNASLALANSASQPGHGHTLSQIAPDVDYNMDVFSLFSRNQSVSGYTDGAYFDLNMSSDMQDVDITTIYGRDVGVIYVYASTAYLIGGRVNTLLSPMHRYIVNRGPEPLTLTHEDMGSTEIYRQNFPGNVDYVLGVNEGVHLHYHADGRRRFAVDTGVSAGGAVAWGDITGDIGIQADLQAELDNKSNTGHTHTASDIADFQESVEDIIGTKIVSGANVTVSYNDATGETTIASSGGGGGGGGGLTYTAISTNTTLSSGNLYDVTCSTANITLTLPALTAGDTLEVRKADSTRYSVIINAPSIMGGTSISVTTQYEAVTLFYIGSTFIII